MNLLITGGLGYIGSHTVLRLLHNGHKVCVIDNLSNSSVDTIPVIKQHSSDFEFINLDLKNFTDLTAKLVNHTFDACIHFAASIEVGKSVTHSTEFFDNNVLGSQNLYKVLLNLGVPKLIFSSTAAVYGTPENTPIKEDDKINPENPYATSKYISETLLKDYAKFNNLNVIALRYFNPAGSYQGILGENHKDESHLIPRLLRSIKQPEQYQFSIYGTDYPTPDGTAIRDFIHIEDLVDAHLVALDYLNQFTGFDVFNVGTGKGNSIMEVIKLAEQISTQKISYSIMERRKGDSAILVADIAKIKMKMNWQAKYNIEDIIRSAWAWENK